jgi:hypothetical protein
MGARTLDFSDAPVVSLESQLQRLALEATAIANVIDTFKSIVPALSERLHSVYSSLKSQDDLSKEVTQAKISLRQVKPKFAHANYLSYSKTLVSVPEGFKGNLLDYVHMLAEMAPEVFAEANKTLGSYNFALAAFITNKEDKTSLQDHTHVFKQVAERREALNVQFGVFFPKATSLSKAYLGEAISRFADVDVMVQEIEKLNTQRKNQNIKEISESVKKCVDLLDIIVQDTQHNGIAKVSGAAAMSISEGAYEIGKYVEFIAIYRYRVEQAIASATKLVQTLERVL